MLQEKERDILAGYRLIQTVRDTIEQKKRDVDATHDIYYAEALQLEKSLDIPETIPRLCGRQRHRTNTPSDGTPSTYYRRTVTLPLLDHLSQLDERFSTKNLMCANAFGIIPSLMIEEEKWRESFKTFLDFYSDDTPCMHSVDSEMDVWYTYWTKILTISPIP